MPKNVYINGQPQTLQPSMVIGQGGEAVVYRLKGGDVLKLYMEPSDPTYAGNPDAQTGAKFRIKEHQTKLPAFPHNVPPLVVAPEQLAYDHPSGGQVVGYTMPFLSGMEVLLSFSDRRYREAHGIDNNQVVELFRALRRLVEQIHTASIVIGDFNDLNVLVDPAFTPHIVDADSMQYGSFLCRTFTARFVDPLICGQDQLVMKQPHNPMSDWYAFCTMLFQCLLFINPYFGGVHKPKSGKSLRNDARVLNRLTVLSPEVIYPKVALPLNCLPDELLDYFHRVYEKDQREIFPGTLLDNLRWTSCSSCHMWHARRVCPGCAAPGVVAQVTTVRGNVTATRLFQTVGRILYATYQRSGLKYVYHEGNTYRRENGYVVLNGSLDGELRFRLWSDKTVIAKGNRMHAIDPKGARQEYQTETVGRLPIFDANSEHLYWLDHGRLVHDAPLEPEIIGDTLENQTLIWVGERFGFGFYRAGALTRGFVFDVRRPGINDRVPLPPIRGTLIDATCAFSDHLAWFMLSVQENGVIKRLCYVVSDEAGLVAQTSAVQGDGSWLGDGIRGRLAIGQDLYAATDEGIVRVKIIAGIGIVPDRQFPDTEPFVSADTQLLPDKGGIIAVSPHEIVLLQIK